MPKEEGNVFQAKYWSTVPYRLGNTSDGNPVDYAKYKIVPCRADPPQKGSQMEIPPVCKDPGSQHCKSSQANNYLAQRMTADLGMGGACLEFQVQLRKGNMPLDEASVEWSEDKSLPVTVATIRLPQQAVTQHAELCENMSFTPWHSLPEHQPEGSIGKLRGFVYSWMAEYRRRLNQETENR